MVARDLLAAHGNICADKGSHGFENIECLFRISDPFHCIFNAIVASFILVDIITLAASSLEAVSSTCFVSFYKENR